MTPNQGSRIISIGKALVRRGGCDECVEALRRVYRDNDGWCAYMVIEAWKEHDLEGVIELYNQGQL